MDKNNLTRGSVQEESVAKISREDLKSVFHLYCGRPDNATKIFEKPITIRFEDLYELESMIQEKLKHYNPDAVSISIGISFENGLSKNFSSLTDFEEKIKQGHEKTESILIRWDFLLKLPIYTVPQRHTLTFRAATAIKLSQILQYALSDEAAEVDKLDTDMAPALCRVDFVDHLLSQELIDIVIRWYEGRPKLIVQSSIYYKLKKYRTTIANLIHWSIPFFFSILFIALLLRSSREISLQTTITFDHLRNIILWLYSTGIILYGIKQFSYWLGGKSFSSLHKYGKFGAFTFTRGDANKQSELEQSNQDTVNSFLISAGVAFVINIISGIIVALLMKN